MHYNPLRSKWERKSFYSRRCQLLKVEVMMVLESHYFVIMIAIIDLDMNHQRMIKL